MPVAGQEFGIVGLGRFEKGLRVVVTSRSGAPRDLVAAGLIEIAGLSGFRAQLRPPRAVLLYIPAGAAVDSILDELVKALEPGDVVADGGNSYWGDSIRRHARAEGRRGRHGLERGQKAEVLVLPAANAAHRMVVARPFI